MTFAYIFSSLIDSDASGDVSGGSGSRARRSAKRAARAAAAACRSKSKFATFTNELEVLYWVYGWDEEGRTP